MSAPKRKAGRPKGSKDSYPRSKNPLDEVVYGRVSKHVLAMIDYVANGSDRTRAQVISDQLALVYRCSCETCSTARREARARVAEAPIPRSFLKGDA